MPIKKFNGVRPNSATSKIKKAGNPKRTEKDGSPPKKFSFPIVGIGASAGGLEAFEQFFTHMPPDTGMAFVLIQHLYPKHRSILSELVQRYTKMAVREVVDGVLVEPNVIYVIPPNRDLALLHGRLHLLEQSEVSGVRTPIDFFFRSLAEDRKEEAICIVLSGTGTEGALGLRAVKGEGGLVMVQDPESAKYDGMPRSALATGLVDYILPPEKMPNQLIGYLQHTLEPTQVKTPGDSDKKNGDIQKLFLLIRSQTGHDFSYYKQNTIMRRIERRMALNQITRLSDYIRHMQEDNREAFILFKELLIGVTNFFRDKEAFDVLREKAIPKLFDNRSPDDPVRIWVPGCATGEEAYSIAILCRDYLSTNCKNASTQVFATDIDGEAIETARQGLYPKSIAADVPPEYVERFFSREDSFFRVKKEIRDRVVFASQNVISDPPFSKIDLISCRNLLIYLGSELQKKVLPLFHYSLKKDGFLFLGPSETIGDFTDFFSVVNRKWKLYKRRGPDLVENEVLDFQIPPMSDRKIESQVAKHGLPIRATNYREVAEKIILENYGPTALVINEKNEVVYIHGRAGMYLEPPPGNVSVDILAMAREGLKLELANSLRKVVNQKEEIRTEHVRVKTNGDYHFINLIVKPIFQPESMKGMVMVLFEEVKTDGGYDLLPQSRNGIDAESDPRIQRLEQELKATKEYLQTAIEELETSNEELKSTNEELQSSIEELQSTNEELETSKEELQSINEELTTVNYEHQQKIEELSNISSDLNNLLASTEIGTIFLDIDLNIRRFTPAATEFFNLLHSDIGRPVTHLATNMNYNRLSEDSKKVLRQLVQKETEVQTRNGRWFVMRILPYRTVENVIDGVVITFVEVTQRIDMEKKLRGEIAQREKSQREAVRAMDYAESIVNTVRGPLVVLDGDLRIVSANHAFYQTFQVTSEETHGNLFYVVKNGRLNIPGIRELLEEILPGKTEVIDHQVDHVFPEIGHKSMVLNARQLAHKDGGEETKLILLAFEDRTGQPLKAAKYIQGEPLP